MYYLGMCKVSFFVPHLCKLWVDFLKAPITTNWSIFSATHALQVMMALSVCECFYIYLGDLTRYYQQYVQDKPDWSKPRR